MLCNYPVGDWHPARGEHPKVFFSPSWQQQQQQQPMEQQPIKYPTTRANKTRHQDCIAWQETVRIVGCVFGLRWCRGHGMKATRHSNNFILKITSGKHLFDNVWVGVPIRNRHAALGLKHVTSTRLLHERVQDERVFTSD